MLAQRCDAEIVAIEPDRESYYQASENVKHCKWSNRIKLENTDLQSYSLTGGKFDLIVSNPPYFNNSLKNPDPRLSVARHTETLNSDDLLEGVSELLEVGGRFQLILPYVEGSIFIAEAHKYELYANTILKIKSLPTSEIRRLVLSFSHESQKVTEKFLTIEHGKRHEYSEEYINLTKDFYLKF
jgi:tRNA1Val (adenine37-N6)-methyltransferase